MDTALSSSHSYQTHNRTCYAVWEITLKCNLACNHCGSRAGDARSNELSTAEALDLVHQMAAAGITEVTLIGGEAYLRKDWADIAAEIVKQGMICSMTIGGYGVNRTTAQRMKEAGVNQISVSIDGMRRTHDRLRGKIDSWKYAFEAMEHLHAVGIPFGANSQVNRYSAPEFPLMYEALLAAGAKAWQIQMTVPMGNAADNSEMLLQPSELPLMHALLSYLTQHGHREGLIIQPGNNFGYYGPYDRLLRSHGKPNKQWSFWRGCSAGLAAIGIEADGTIKGCPSLPTNAYSGGNIRDHDLADILLNREELTFNLKAGTPEGTDHLWGFCKTCDYAELCRGACNWTSHVFFDRRGNNPYCHHRSLVNAANGLREQVKIKRQANGLPFDNGEFSIEAVPTETPWTEERPLFQAAAIQWPERWQEDQMILVQWLNDEVTRNIANTRRALQQNKAKKTIAA